MIKTKKRRIAFIYDKDPGSSDWIYGHELGRLHILDVFGDELETNTYIVDLSTEESEEHAEKLIDDICNDGCNIIFAVTPTLIKACLKAAVNHPDDIILNCSLNSSYNTVRTYYTRMYEAKFLTGMIAGAMCTNNKIGFRTNFTRL